MKKRVVLFLAVLLLLASVCWPAAEAHATVMSVHGECGITASGKSVTFSGTTSSAKNEDTIQVTITLWEQRDGQWYAISSATKAKENAIFVAKSKTVTVSGGHYYKVTASHYVQTGSTSNSTTSSTSSIWISN